METGDSPVPVDLERTLDHRGVSMRVAQYEILGELGQGNMGVVYRARDVKLRREVALKCPRPHLGRDPAQRRRFLREARAASRLAHPGIVPVFEVFEFDDRPWLAMALIEGKTLAQVLKERNGPLPMKQVLIFAVQLADALCAAHRANVLHRDLKPSNVMIADGGRALITDFGLARLLAPQDQTDLTKISTLTAEGNIVGTPAYMSPEQVLSKPLDERSDVFALGVVIYEMSTGKLPFTGGIGEILDAVVHKDPPALSETNPSATNELDRVVRKAMAKQPDARYTSAAELHEDLDGLERQLEFEEYVEEHPTSSISVSVRRRRRRRRFLAALAVTLSVTGIAMGARACIDNREGWAGKNPVMQALVTWPGAESGSRFSPDGALVSFRSDRPDGNGLWLKSLSGGEPRMLERSPRSIEDHLWSPDGRQIACLVPLRGGNEEALLQVIPAEGGPPINSIKVVKVQRATRLVRWIAPFIYLESNGGLSRFKPGSDRIEQMIPPDPESGQKVNFDVRPDGKRVAYQLDYTIWISDLDGSRARSVTSGEHAKTPFWWGPRGRHLVYSSDRGGQVDLWNLLPGSTPRQITSSSAVEYPEDVSPDGKALTVLEVLDFSNLWVMDPNTGNTWQLTGDSLQDFWPSASTDGLLAFHRRRPSSEPLQGIVETEILAASLREGDLLDTRRIVELGWAAAVSPDGAFLAYSRPEEDSEVFSVSDLWIQDLESGHAWIVAEGFEPSAITLFPLERFRRNLLWSTDGRELFFVSDHGDSMHLRRASPLDQQTSSEMIVSIPKPALTGDISLSPDGRRLSYVQTEIPTWTSQLRVFDLESSEDRPAGKWAGKTVYSPGWLADGDTMVAAVSTSEGVLGERLEIFLFDGGDPGRSIGTVGRAFGSTIRLDARRGLLYLTKVDDGRNAHNLYRLDLSDGRLARITNNSLRGTTFSGLEILADGSIVYARHEKNENLWTIRIED